MANVHIDARSDVPACQFLQLPFIGHLQLELRKYSAFILTIFAHDIHFGDAPTPLTTALYLLGRTPVTRRLVML